MQGGSLFARLSRSENLPERLVGCPVHTSHGPAAFRCDRFARPTRCLVRRVGFRRRSVQLVRSSSSLPRFPVHGGCCGVGWRSPPHRCLRSVCGVMCGVMFGVMCGVMFGVCVFFFFVAVRANHIYFSLFTNIARQYAVLLQKEREFRSTCASR
jgi:hypothetical protein